MTITFKLDTDPLNKLLRKLDDGTGEVVKAAAFQIEAIAKTLAPVDTGTLKNSIQTEQKGEQTYWVSDGVEYGIYQELGTSSMAAQPFLVPAVEMVGNQIAQMVEQKVFGE